MDRRPPLPLARPRGASPRRRVRSAVIPIAVAAVVIAGGCGGVGGEELGSPSPGSAPAATQPPATEAPTTTTAPPSPDEVEVRAVLDRFWPVYLEAYADPVPDRPVLAEVLTDEAESTILRTFEDMARRRQRTVAPEPSVLTHHVLTITFPEPDRASVRECLVDDLHLIQDIDPHPSLPEGAHWVIDDDVVTSEITTGLIKDESGWLITMREQTERLEGVRDCGIFTP